jgi:drug/metabolite transporter (DMT)-like permease
VSPNAPPSPANPPRTLVLLAFAAVYLIWGSTYLAIRIGVETMPPFLLGGVRFTLAGALMLLFLKLRGWPWPTRLQARNSAVAGAVMLLGGNGLVAWAEQFVTSSFAALFIASAPVWFAVIEWARPGGHRPAWPVWLGISLGLTGVALLVLRREAGLGPIHWGGALALLLATMCWAAGSMFAKYTAKPASPWMGASLQMLSGGLVMCAVAAGLGEFGRLQTAVVSFRSLAALGYLIVFGSWLGFSAYVWLLGVSSPAKVSTYAYVNPVIAIFLGWALLGERLTPPMGLAAAVIVGAVVLLTWPRPPARA